MTRRLTRALGWPAALFALTAVTLASASAQKPPGSVDPTAQPNGPSPTFADIDYAPPEPATSKGHKLDLYLPPNARTPMPVVIWTADSAWMSDMGKGRAEVIAAQLLPLGYAVAGVSIRSSAQVKFPGQLHDIKAAIRWLRANAAKYHLDPDHIGLIGDSSGGWTTAMAALTGDAPDMEGSVGVKDGSSRVQAAVAFTRRRIS
jgi:acetyl esterase/lipase